MGETITGLFQTGLILLSAPLVNGVIKRTKALLQNRKGPGVLQGYADLNKLFHKDRVISEHSSWIFRVTPFIVFAATAAVTTVTPAVTLASPFGFRADLLLVVYLFGLARFFSALAGLDAGSSFGGMGSSREMTFAAMIEPALLLALFVVALAAGSTELSVITKNMGLPGALSPALLLAFAAMLIVAVAETGRVPVDNPDTHLELTMVHEGMLLEYSGKELGLMLWAAQIKQLLILTFLANFFLPAGIAVAPGIAALFAGIIAYAVKICILAVVLAVVETAFAKLRLFKVPRLLAVSFTLSLFALVSLFVIGGKL